jgi:anti-sigma factor RsiW
MNSKQYEMLLAYVAGESSPAEEVEVRKMIATDPHALKLEARLRTIVTALRSDDSQAPPTPVVAEVQALFRSRRPPPAPGALAAIQRVIAQLVFDSRATPAVAGLRGGNRIYQLAFESDLAAVDLEIAPAPHADARRILGQISPSGGQRVRTIHLAPSAGGAATSSAHVDAHGGFTLDTSAGRFDVVIRFDAGELVLPNLDVT